MTQQEIEKIIKNNIIYNEVLVNEDEVVKEIYKLHLEDKINLLNSFNFGFCHECDNSGIVYNKLEELQQELKSLEND